MKDRVPLYPGRVTLTPVAGQPDTYDLVRADQPIEEGTPLNKSTLLRDFTAQLLGLDPLKNPTVDDAFIISILSAKNACYVHLTVMIGGKAAFKGMPVTGLTGLDGSTTLYTDENGEVAGLTTKTNTTLTTGNFVDIPAKSTNISTPIKTLVNATIQLPAPTSGTRNYVGSASVIFSPYVESIDVACCGGGGGGGGVKADIQGNDRGAVSGGGGGGGYITNAYNVSFVPLTAYQIVVGSGGYGGNGADGGVGGETTFLGVVASGGTGGGLNSVSKQWDNGHYRISGNGYGGSGNGGGGGNAIGSMGTAATQRVWGNEQTAGGGGGSGKLSTDTTPNGGAPNGGNGCASGAAPSGGGGGGYKCAGYADGKDEARSAGRGGSGAVYIRFRVKG